MNHPDEPCICEHERKWHNACSKCPCPFFLSAAADHPESIVRAWHRNRDRRGRKEA